MYLIINNVFRLIYSTKVTDSEVCIKMYRNKVKYETKAKYITIKMSYVQLFNATAPSLGDINCSKTKHIT